MTLPIEKAQIAKTTEQWTSLNPVLDLDVIGIEVMTNGYNRYKRGDGSTTWNSLSYIDKVYSDQAVTSVNNQTGAVTLTKSDVGLGSVDNTADSSKSVYDSARLGGSLPSAFLSSAVTDISNLITTNQGTKNIIAKKMGNLVFIGGYFAGISVSANAETLIGSVAAGYRTLVGCSGSAYFLKNNGTAYPGTVYFSAGGDILIMAPSALTSVDAYIGIMYMTS